MNLNNSTILVTGGAGFIGSHLVDKLAELGSEVVVVDNFNNYYPPEFKKENVSKFSDHENVILYKCDIRNKNKLYDIFDKHNIDRVAHMAARAGVRSSIEEPELYTKVNINGTQNLLELSIEYDVVNFVFASSSSVYGNREEGPFRESDLTREPTSHYAATKQAGERLIYSYSHLHDLRAIALRFFTVYGERGRPDMAPYIFTKAILKDEVITKFGDGSSRRDYTYVGDVVDAVTLALESDNIEYEIVNIGGGNPTTLNDFIATLEEIIGKKADVKQLPEQPGDVFLTHADVSKAENILGWNPSFALDDGLKRFVGWFQSNRI